MVETSLENGLLERKIAADSKHMEVFQKSTNWVV